MKNSNKVILLSVLFSVLILSSCSNKKKLCYACNENESSKVAEFVTSNMKNSNNMSDEEMEDVILELRRTGIKLHCKQKLLSCSFDNSINWNWVDVDSTLTYHPYL